MRGALRASSKQLTKGTPNTDMYTHWQAAWRGAGVLGLVLLALATVPAFMALQAGHALSSLPALITIVAAGIVTTILAVSFRVGLYLSGIKGVGLPVIIAIPALYALLLVVLSTLPVETHAVTLDMPSPGQSRHALLMFELAPVGVLAIEFLVLPLVVAFVVARIARGGANVA